MEEAMGAAGRGPGLYEFLIESELQHYYSGLKNDLKVNTVAQIKYVEDDDLGQIGMSKPEVRRLKKYFHKYYPQTYLRRIKQMILPKREDGLRSSHGSTAEMSQDKQSVKVPSKHIIPSEAIVANKELGIGEFGVVQQGVWTNEDGERIQVAIKRLSKERMQNNPMEFLKEAAIMHTIDHEHIVRLYGVVLETNDLMLVTELAPLRSLLECLKEPALRPSFPVISLCDFALQICDGMQYLESKRLIHRDLAARNILVFSKNKIKISDFGLSRALGVGKDYYQTNFNVNLKLPIAWCAPECINYLRFTSASDVWAYGVTLWEMFSYGFQPWAALTGQQILEAIDEPNFQRLEQPDCCPKEYYILTLKCWQHDPNKRPKFSEIYAMLPECKPEQVQAINDHNESTSNPKPKRDQLQYKVGDVITVLDKKPLADQVNVWKGVLSGGKTGHFNPANTVAYLGTNIPTMKPAFIRGDGKSSVYSSKRRTLRPDMISRPQADFRHTGHVGLDGAFFGDISCLGDKYHLLPKQIVTPYKPQEDGAGEQGPSLTRTSSDVSDRAPLLLKGGEIGKNGTAPETWPESNGAIQKTVVDGGGKPSNDTTKPFIADHEYHEISDDETQIESPRFDNTFFQRCLDFGPSLMDEVFKALGTKHEELEEGKDEATNAKNEIKETSATASNSNTLTKTNGSGVGGSVGGGSGATAKKKQVSAVKPLSASLEKTMESAIAMANEMATKSMLDTDQNSDNDKPLESPHTPSSPTKRKFSFRLPTSKASPKPERRNFAEEAAAIPDIQESLTDEAKEAYNSLVEKGEAVGPTLMMMPPQCLRAEKTRAEAGRVEMSRTDAVRAEVGRIESSRADVAEVVEEETNPLRMLRSGVPVRPKVRGNKHAVSQSVGRSMSHSETGGAASGGYSQQSLTSSLRRASESRVLATNSNNSNNNADSAANNRFFSSSATNIATNLEALRSSTSGSVPTNSGAFKIPSVVSTLPKTGGVVKMQTPPPAPPTSSSNLSTSTSNDLDATSTTSSSQNGGGGHHENGSGGDSSSTSSLNSASSSSNNNNPLPLPPRDRTKPNVNSHKPRQRKYPLIIPGSSSRPLVKPSLSLPDVSPVHPPQHNGRHERLNSADECSVSSEQLSPLVSPTSTVSYIELEPNDNNGDAASVSGEDENLTSAAAAAKPPPAKPPRTMAELSSSSPSSPPSSDSFDNQIQADMDSLDDIPEEDAPPVPPQPPPAGATTTGAAAGAASDHRVSCEDLLDFACDRPNAKRTQGRARGIDSDEVRIMQKVLTKEIPVTPNECLVTLNETDWDVHKAIKYLKLQRLLRTQLVSDTNCKQTLSGCDWDVQKAYSYLLATYGVTEDSTEV